MALDLVKRYAEAILQLWKGSPVILPCWHSPLWRGMKWCSALLCVNTSCSTELPWKELWSLNFGSCSASAEMKEQLSEKILKSALQNNFIEIMMLKEKEREGTLFPFHSRFHSNPKKWDHKIKNNFSIKRAASSLASLTELSRILSPPARQRVRAKQRDLPSGFPETEEFLPVWPGPLGVLVISQKHTLSGLRSPCLTADVQPGHQSRFGSASGKMLPLRTLTDRGRDSSVTWISFVH